MTAPAAEARDAVVVVGVGMTTAVGLSAPETAASVRAGTMRLSVTDFRDRFMRPIVVGELPDAALPALAPAAAAGPSTAREARLLRLASGPLRECVAPLAARGPLPGLALCLALPETETTQPIDRARFLARLATQTGGIFVAGSSDASHTGRAGGLLAVGQAVATIASGRSAFVLAGGIDSYRDPWILGTLDMEQRLKTTANLDGFVPGEGAGFLLLASERAARAAGLPVLARVSSVAMAFEPGHLYSAEPYRGEGLAVAVRQLGAGGALPAPAGDVWSSMNGESHWAKEWGVCEIRNRGVVTEDRAMHHPADCYGDTGAAAGPLLVGLAVLRAVARQQHTPALVYASGDRGHRAAVAVTLPS